MAKTTARIHRATGLALIAGTALLVGPHSTFGLDTGAVTGAVDQVSATTQTVVTTTEQTVDTAQTTVEQTTQTLEQTVQTTVEQAAAPVPTAAPAPAASAPTQTSSPARRQSTSVAAPGSPVRRAAERVRRVQRGAASKVVATTGTERGAARSTVDAIRTAAAKKQRSGSRRSAPARQSADPAPTCLPVQMPPLLAALELSSLLSLLCTTIELPVRGGGPSTPAGTTAGSEAGVSPVQAIARVLGVVASVASPTNPLALLAPDDIRLLGERASGDAATAGDASVAAGRASGSSYPATSAPAHAAGRSVVGYTRGGAVLSAKHDPVQGHGDGVTGAVNATNALMTVLAIDLALLAAILLWRAARRWVVPRLA